MRPTCTHGDCDAPVMGRGLCQKHYNHAVYHGELPDKPEPRPCQHCGQMFAGRKWNARYCSRRCNGAARYARERQAPVADACLQCGKPLPEQRRRDRRFCSMKCSNDWHNAQRSALLLAAKAARARSCRGCGDPIPPQRVSNALYCTEACKIASRRHEAYGLTKTGLEMLLAQHERCAICETSEWGRKGPQVDHCHDTGRVRGVLCINCNNGLGRFADDPARLRAAADYLERVPA